jgi:hypothetical protein
MISGRHSAAWPNTLSCGMRLPVAPQGPWIFYRRACAARVHGRQPWRTPALRAPQLRAPVSPSLDTTRQLFQRSPWCKGVAYAGRSIDGSEPATNFQRASTNRVNCLACILRRVHHPSSWWKASSIAESDASWISMPCAHGFHNEQDAGKPPPKIFWRGGHHA